MTRSAEVFFFPKKSPPQRRHQTVTDVRLRQAEISEGVDDTPTQDEEPTDPEQQRPAPSSGATPHNSVQQLLSSPNPRRHLNTLTRKQRTHLAVQGHALFEQGEVATAKRLFELLVEAEPEESFPYTMLGTILLSEAHYDRALALFEAALSVDPSDVAARVYRAEVRLHRGRPKVALDDLSRAIELGDPADPFVERARRLRRIAKKALQAPAPRTRR